MNIGSKLSDLIQHPKTKTVVLTGAGISKESGVPTFRDPDGLWAKFKPEELANMDAFLANTELVWSWYQHRREIINSVAPNPGHITLTRMEKFFDSFTLVTQNVDNLHQIAGNQNVLELHGNIQNSFCIDCETPWRDQNLNETPQCLVCGGKVRPGVVWFGEMLPETTLDKAFTAAKNCDLILSVGTAGVVYPAAAIPLMAIEFGAYSVEINPTETEISAQFDECLRGPSGEVLPLLFPE